MSKNIIIFYHIYRMYGYSKLVHDQLDRLKTSGLYDAASEIKLCIVGQGPPLDWVLMEFPKCTIAYDSQENSFENKTINAIHSYCTNNPKDLIFYFHTKGITQPNNSNVNDWRLLMEYFCIDNWKTCVKLLTYYGRTTVGVNLHLEPVPHYSGNFWWACGSHVAGLEKVETDSRMSAEFFILSNGIATACSLFESGINHYIRPFPDFKFIKTPVKNHIIAANTLLKSFRPTFRTQWLKVYSWLN